MNKRSRTSYKIVNLTADDFYSASAGKTVTSSDFWRLGHDNNLPGALSILNRKSPIHRGILNSKTTYFVGRGFSQTKNSRIDNLVLHCNGSGTSLRNELKKIIFDRLAFGNGWMEIVKKPGSQWISIYHQDTVYCRISKDKKNCLLYHDWSGYTELNKNKVRKVAIYPNFSDDQNTGYQHSIIHFKEHEPGFENYGVIPWLAGLNVSGIAYKTNKWNISRLDNSFSTSGVLVIDGEFDDDNDADEFKEAISEEFIGEGNQGKLLTITATKGEDRPNETKFIPISTQNEGDWLGLQQQSTTEMIVAHGWFRSLTSLPDNTGFDTQRILNEYNIALNTVILDEQEYYMEVIRTIIQDQLGQDASELSIVNKPPLVDYPPFMRIWEARKMHGLEFDPKDTEQQSFIATLTKPKEKTPTAP